MNPLSFLLIISLFITLFYDNNSIKLRFIIADGFLITVALSLSVTLLSAIERLGDLGVFRIPFSALACFGVYSVLASLILKENAVGTVIPTAMVMLVTVFDFSFLSVVGYGLLLTVFMTVFHTLKIRNELGTIAPLSLCSAGLIALVIDALK